MSASVLITGAGGMIGSHLATTVLDAKHTVLATYYRPTIDMAELPAQLTLCELDIRYTQHVEEIVERALPDWIFHLAAQSYPTVSRERPQETLETNVIGTTNVFEAVRRARRLNRGYDPVVVCACSSAEYGDSFFTAKAPLTESAQLLPLHPYGVSKVATDLLAFQYFRSDNIRSVRARIFNTSGPRKRGDVISDFSRRIASMPPGDGTLRVGNLAPKRAYLHVADMVRALIGLAEMGRAGEVYNISGHELVSVQELIPMFEKASGRRLSTIVDEALLRPNDEPIIVGDNTKIQRDIGWNPLRSVSDIVQDVYAYEASKVGCNSPV
jgi:GDP-4-dehydro-6-deoxy-D-mannose reductase